MSDRVIVVGGGPAGLMAAGRAAERGARVLLIEKTSRLGNKLRLSGGGHGNITHIADGRPVTEHLGPNGGLLSDALSQFGPRELVTFFQEHGMPTVVDDEGRVLPAARNAHIIASSLKAWCLTHQVTFRYRSPVSQILSDRNQARGVIVDDREILGAAIVLATGGMSYPGTGSTGDGYALARALGHRIIPPVPGLVPLVVSEAWVPALSGLALRSINLSAYQRSELLGRRHGDVVFTRDGLSGPAALDLSLDLSRALEQGPVLLEIDIRPEVSLEALDSALAQAFQSRGSAGLATLLRGYVPSALVSVVVQLADVAPAGSVAELSAAQRLRVARILKGLELHVVGTRSMQEAMVTVGGVSVDDIDPATMASRIVRGLYMAGEVIDVAGETGGYNLQAAFASGRLAGEAATSA